MFSLSGLLQPVSVYIAELKHFLNIFHISLCLICKRNAFFRMLNLQGLILLFIFSLILDSPKSKSKKKKKEKHNKKVKIYKKK